MNLTDKDSGILGALLPDNARDGLLADIDAYCDTESIAVARIYEQVGFRRIGTIGLAEIG